MTKLVKVLTGSATGLALDYIAGNCISLKMKLHPNYVLRQDVDYIADDESEVLKEVVFKPQNVAEDYLLVKSLYNPSVAKCKDGFIATLGNNKGIGATPEMAVLRVIGLHRFGTTSEIPEELLTGVPI